MQPNKEQVAALRKNSVVAAWIRQSSSSKDFLGKNHPDCSICGWPHSPYVQCGVGAMFGSVRLGGCQFGIDASNVEYMLSLIGGLGDLGFHWKNERFFNVKDGAVVVTYFEQFNGHPNMKQWRIPLGEWQAIVDFVGERASAVV